MELYIIGSLRNRAGVLEVADALEAVDGINTFTSWLAPGEEADDKWKEYEQARGRSYLQALDSWAARHVFEFDKFHLDRCDGAVLVYPAGRSCHLEAGYMRGKGKPVWGLISPEEETQRWDCMTLFLSGLYDSLPLLCQVVRGYERTTK